MIKLTRQIFNQLYLSYMYTFYNPSNGFPKPAEVWRYLGRNTNQFQKPHDKFVYTAYKENADHFGFLDENQLHQALQRFLNAQEREGAEGELLYLVQQLIQSPYAKNILGGHTLNDLRQALLAPSDLVALQARLALKEMFCAGCGRELAHLEMVTIRTTDRSNTPGAGIYCANCIYPEKIACIRSQCGEAVELSSIKVKGLRAKATCEHVPTPPIKAGPEPVAPPEAYYTVGATDASRPGTSASTSTNLFQNGVASAPRQRTRPSNLRPTTLTVPAPTGPGTPVSMPSTAASSIDTLRRIVENQLFSINNNAEVIQTSSGIYSSSSTPPTTWARSWLPVEDLPMPASPDGDDNGPA